MLGELFGEADDGRPYDPRRGYTDGATVRGVQAALEVLAMRQGDPALSPRGVDGIWGPNTAAAVGRFNTIYRGWPDETTITAGTLESLRYAGVLGASSSGNVAPRTSSSSSTRITATGNAAAGSSASGSAAVTSSSRLAWVVGAAGVGGLLLLLKKKRGTR